MNILLKLEEAAIFLLCIFLFSKLNYAWWWFPALLFVPDIGMLGYLINPKVGAYTYNLLHLRVVAAIVGVYAIYSDHEIWKLVTILLFAHISFDRMMGYGLKHTDGFTHTHLGMIGKNKRD